MDIPQAENKTFDDPLTIQEASSCFMSRMVIEETADEEKNYVHPEIPSTDSNKVFLILEEDLKRKDEFLNSEELQQYEQLLIVSQIRKDFTNDDPFLQHLFTMEKAIRKEFKNTLIINKRIENKQQWNEIQKTVMRLFYQDINISFITSTGQIKSTAFVFVNKLYFDTILTRKTNNLQFAKQAIRISLNIIDPNTILMKEPQQIDFKNSFLRNNKFANQFILLNKIYDEQKQILAVYTPIDDQIYAIKKSKLTQTSLSFHSIFSQNYCPETHRDYKRINEAKILSKLTHPNILRLYEWWIEQQEGCYFLYQQLEFCSFPGVKFQPNDLLSFSYFYMNPMKNEEKLTKIQEITLQILDALEYIHKRGIIHRDLKPENIFVTISITGEFQIKLADFDQSQDLLGMRLQNQTQVDEKQELKSPGIKPRAHIYDLNEEFYAIGVLLLHLLLTFPGEPIKRNHYIKTFSSSQIDEVLPLFNNWATLLVRNRNPEFNFNSFKAVLDLSKNLMSKKFNDHKEIRQIVQTL